MRYNIKIFLVLKEEEEKILDYRELFAFGETALNINLNFKQYFKQRKFEKKSEIRDLNKIQIILRIRNYVFSKNFVNGSQLKP